MKGEEMEIRRAGEKDLEGVHRLLGQVLAVHAEGRPDLFRAGTRKYTDEELLGIFADDSRPVFVAVEGGEVLGHAFCELNDYRSSNNMQPILSLYVDDICVDENARGKGVGKAVYEYVRAWAKEEGYYNLTLNVRSCNPGAMKFYLAMGLTPYKTGMETIL